MGFKETNYNTVLDRIFIRTQLNGKWDSYSLRQMLNHQEEIWEWLEIISRGGIKNETPNIPLTEEELIDMIKWLDKRGTPPVRIKDIKELGEGAVVLMKESSGMLGYGNYQCISWYSPEIGELSLYGHNEHYHDYDVEKIIKPSRESYEN